MAIIINGYNPISKTNITANDLLQILNNKHCGKFTHRNVSISGFSTILDSKYYPQGSIVKTTYLKTGDNNFEITNKQIFPACNKRITILTSYINKLFRRASVIDLKTNVSFAFEKKNGKIVQKNDYI